MSYSVNFSLFCRFSATNIVDSEQNKTTTVTKIAAANIIPFSNTDHQTLQTNTSSSESSSSQTSTQESRHIDPASLADTSPDVPILFCPGDNIQHIVNTVQPPVNTTAIKSSKTITGAPKPKRKRLSVNQKSKDKDTTNPERSYDTPDTTNNLPPFKPTRDPGVYLDVPARRNFKEVDFFHLFFTNDLISSIVEHTNTYAWMNIIKKKKYASKDGSWKETSPNEIRMFIALLLYMGVVNVPAHDRYWSIKSLFHGLWARVMMPRLRFKALLAMLHVVDPGSEQAGDKLRKVNSFIDQFRDRCVSLYQPAQNQAVDERLVKSKHRSGIRQYLKNKPAKFGIKLWVIADSATGYTCDFRVYTGSGDGLAHKDYGLGYGVVTTLAQPYLHQGYMIFFDNFYTSVPLVGDLFDKGTPSCGTVTENRKGFPLSMKGGKTWGQKKERGSMRWKREGKTLCLQWKDNKIVTMLSTIDLASDYFEVERKVKVDGVWTTITVKQPACIKRYNSFMNGVDKSDQYLSKYNVLRKCIRWWKTLFFHLVDIAIVNGFIIFQNYRASNPQNELLARPRSYSMLDFREAVIRQLADLEEYADPPVYKSFVPPAPNNIYATEHLPEVTDKRGNCRLCYRETKIEYRVNTRCTAPQCMVHLHMTKEKNCFAK